MNSEGQTPGALFLRYGLISALWSLWSWMLMKALHNRVEYFLVGPANALILGSALLPLIVAIVFILRPGSGRSKAASALGLAIPALVTLTLILARLSA